MALIAGPTASGKSARALELAERENGVIVNADASQVYRDLRILTARPGEADEARAPHRLYGYRDGAAACSAAEWSEDAKAAIEDIVTSKRLPILVGGTGLYFRTLIDGIAPVPPIAAEIRAEVRSMTAAQAYAVLQHRDPAAAQSLHGNDTTRVHRALETILSTGTPIGVWRARREGGIAGHYRLEIEIVSPPAALLGDRCDSRVDAMLADGAVEEVAELLSRRLDPSLPVMRAIGVRPLISFLAGDISLADAASAIRVATRQYAKRQRTWFRNQPLGRADGER